MYSGFGASAARRTLTRRKKQQKWIHENCNSKLWKYLLRTANASRFSQDAKLQWKKWVGVNFIANANHSISIAARRGARTRSESWVDCASNWSNVTRLVERKREPAPLWCEELGWCFIVHNRLSIQSKKFFPIVRSYLFVFVRPTTGHFRFWLASKSLIRRFAMAR